MRYLHTMVRVSDERASLDFYCNKLGMVEIRRYDSEAGRFTNIFLAAPGDADTAADTKAPVLELTYNWDPEDYTGGRNFGHLAFETDDIYALCQQLQDGGVTIPGRRATGAWPLSVRPMASRSSFCKKARPWKKPNPGRRWKTPAVGERLNHQTGSRHQSDQTKGETPKGLFAGTAEQSRAKP